MPSNQTQRGARPTRVLSAEKQYLGALLLDNRLAYVAPLLRPEYFSTSLHRAIAAAIAQLLGAGQEANLYTVKVTMEKASVLKDAELAAFTDVTSGVVCTAGSVQLAAEQVRQAAKAERFRALLDCAAAQGEDSDVPLTEAIAELQRSLATMEDDDSKERDRTGKQALDGALANVAAVYASGREISGLTFGLGNVDRATGGMRPGEYTICAAWTGVGKSAFALGTALANVKQRIPVGYLATEMDAEELMERAAAALTGIPYESIHEPALLNPEQLEQLNAARKRFTYLEDLHIDDHSRALNEVLVSARRMIARYSIRLLCVDYLQQINVDERDPRLKLNMISEALRQLAKDTRVPVLAVSQLSRPKDPREVPTIYHLKESGQLEQDAHRVLLLHRPLEDGHYTRDDVLIIGKARSGRTGPESVRFNQALLTWEERR